MAGSGEPRGDAAPPGTDGLLVLCRANLIRSPLAAAVLRARLDEHGRADLRVASAGLQIGPADVLPASAAEVALAHDVDLVAHRPQPVSAAQVRAAELVVTMTETQRAVVERLDRACLPRTFTLLELVRLLRAGTTGAGSGSAPGGTVNGTASSTLGGAAGRGFPRWSALARAAHRARPLVPPADGTEDLPDPVGHPRRFQRQVADEIAASCAELARIAAAR